MHVLRVELSVQDEEHFRLRLFQGGDRQPCTTYPIPKTGLAELTDLNPRYYRASASDLSAQGQYLWRWLNSGQERLQEHFPHGSLQLTVGIDDSARTLAGLPWELLHDGKKYLCVHTPATCCPQYRVHGNFKQFETFSRPLRILFMACSPKNVEPVLDFEQEESRILERTQSHPIYLHVEESGSLEGLKEQLEEYPDGFFDVVHITGHARIEDSTGTPMFLMETTEGELDEVSASSLADLFVDCDRYPRLLFLSGCRSGESRENVRSFSEQLVQHGVPVVLGWALPVGDLAASQAAGWLYEKLAVGQSIVPALNYARRKLYRYEQDEKQKPRSSISTENWHLLRLYSDDSPLSALVTAPRLHTGPVVREAQHRFLDSAGRQTEVCTRRNFIGQRRLLQRCLRVLRLPASDPKAVQGVLLYGMGGLGKSSTAARLADRLYAGKESRMENLIVWRGRIDEAIFLQGLLTHLEGVSDDLQNLKIDLSRRLGHLLERRRVLLILDDFEQNLAQKGQPERYTPDSLRIVRALCQAIHRTGSHSRLILTTRYKTFDVPLPACLHPEIPGILISRDLEKKCLQLSQLKYDGQVDKDVRRRAVELAAGVPRLLERMNAVLSKTKNAELPELLRKVESTVEDFREDILIKHLLQLQSFLTRQVLARVALFHLPQPLRVLQALFCDDEEFSLSSSSTENDPLPSTGLNPETILQALQRAQEVGLIDCQRSDDGEQYKVSPLLHIYLRKELDENTRQLNLRRAAQALYQAKRREHFNERDYQEILRLAMEGGETQVAISARYRLTSNLLGMHRWQEVLYLCNDINEGMKDFRVLGNMAYAEFKLGFTECSLSNFAKAFACLPATTDDAMLVDIAIIKRYYASVLHRQGQLHRAFELLQNEIAPVLERLDAKLPSAITKGRIADILQARGELDKALKIRETEQLPVYEQLGDVRNIAVTKGRIADILQARGEVDKALKILETELVPVFEQLGDVLGKAVTKGRIADILQARGELDKALRIRETELVPVYEQLGDVRNIATTKGRIADILQARGEVDKALKILETEQLPVYGQLGDVCAIAVAKGKIADILQDRGEVDKALKIRETEELPVYEQLGDVRAIAVAKGKIADILQARGEVDKALKIRETEELPVYEQLGDVREEAITKGKIADILQARGEVDKALRILETELVPVFEQLGDVRSQALTKGRIADILQARGEVDKALKIRETEELPVYEQLGDVRSKAITKGQIADILQARGEVDEALKIRETEELPVYEQLGDVRLLIDGRVSLAKTLWKKDAKRHRHEVQSLLRSASQDAKRLRISKAGQIEALIAQFGLDCDAVAPFDC